MNEILLNLLSPSVNSPACSQIKYPREVRYLLGRILPSPREWRPLWRSVRILLECCLVPCTFAWNVSVLDTYLHTRAKSMKPTWRDWKKPKLKNQDIVDIRHADFIFDLITVDTWIYPHWPLATISMLLTSISVGASVPLKVVLKILTWNYLSDCNYKSTRLGFVLPNSLDVSPCAHPKYDKLAIMPRFSMAAICLYHQKGAKFVLWYLLVYSQAPYLISKQDILNFLISSCKAVVLTSLKETSNANND